jgi:hypothetical protein
VFRFEFYAKTPSEKKGRTYFLSATSDDERNEWIAAIASWIGHVDDNTKQQSSAGLNDMDRYACQSLQISLAFLHAFLLQKKNSSD